MQNQIENRIDCNETGYYGILEKRSEKNLANDGGTGSQQYQQYQQ